MRAVKGINQNEDDGDISLVALTQNELKNACRAHGSPVSGANSALASRISQCMNRLQATNDAEAAIESDDNFADEVDVSAV